MKFQFLKSSRFCVICAVALLFLILLNVTFGSSSPVPYYPESIFAKQFPYNREGLTGDKEKEEDEKDEEEVEGLDNGTTDNSADESSTTSAKPKEENEGKKEGLNKEKKEGFQGLSSGNFNSEQYMGYLANVKTGGNCGNVSNGLSTSTGYLCMSPDELRYLQSRGGNATSKGDF